MRKTRRTTLAAAALGALVLLSACNDPVPEVLGKEGRRGGPPKVLAEGSMVWSSDRSGTFEILLRDAKTGETYPLTNDVATDSFMPRLSPDRRTVVFHRSPAGVNDGDYRAVSLWTVDVDGSELREISPVGANGWGVQGHPEWSPDGESLVIFGGPENNSQIVVLDLDGRPTALATLRGGMNLDPTWSPDGEWIFFVGCPEPSCEERDYELYRVRPDRSGLERLTSDDLRDHDPAVSPDGLQVAWLTERDPDGGPVGPSGPIGAWDVRVMPVASPPDWSWVTESDAIDSRPVWDDDGASLVLHRLEIGEPSFQLFRLRLSDGSLERLMASDGSDEYPDL